MGVANHGRNTICPATKVTNWSTFFSAASANAFLACKIYILIEGTRLHERANGDVGQAAW